jgi:hypothetical protein
MAKALQSFREVCDEKFGPPITNWWDWNKWRRNQGNFHGPSKRTFKRWNETALFVFYTSDFLIVAS